MRPRKRRGKRRGIGALPSEVPGGEAQHPKGVGEASPGSKAHGHQGLKWPFPHGIGGAKRSQTVRKRAERQGALCADSTGPGSKHPVRQIRRSETHGNCAREGQFPADWAARSVASYAHGWKRGCAAWWIGSQWRFAP